MDTTPHRVRIHSTSEERWELYSILDIRNKLRNGQAYIVPNRTGRNQPRGNFPEGTRTQTVDIFLEINDYRIYRAHRYILGAWEITGPDPKYFCIDDLEIVEEQGG